MLSVKCVHEFNKEKIIVDFFQSLKLKHTVNNICKSFLVDDLFN